METCVASFMNMPASDALVAHRSAVNPVHEKCTRTELPNPKVALER